MARVKKPVPKHSARAPARGRRAQLPRLVDLLPKVAFRWQSKRGTNLLTNAMSRKIVENMNRFFKIGDSAKVGREIALVFENAHAAAKRGNLPEDPVEFWENCAKLRAWSRKLDGVTYQLFAMKLVSARFAAQRREKLDEAARQGVLALTGVQANVIRAIDQFIALQPVRYGFYIDLGGDPIDPRTITPIDSTGIALPDNFIPWWVQDPDNEGDEESTIAYKRLLGKTGNLTLEDLRAKDPNDMDVDEDADDANMDVGEEAYYGEDEDDEYYDDDYDDDYDSILDEPDEERRKFLMDQDAD